MYMNYLTTTQLRTQTSKIVDTLKKKGTISLIHRSKVVGIIRPVIEVKPFNPEAFERLVKELRLPPTTSAQRERRYRRHLIKKYGQGIS